MQQFVLTKISVVLLGLTLVNVGFAQSVNLGIVEAQRDADAPESAPAKTHLRLAFRFEHGEWTSICEGKSSSERNDGCAFQNANEPKYWNILFNGSVVGPLQTQGWRDSEYYSFTGALTIVTAQVPAVDEPLTPFASWTGDATKRPLVAVDANLNQLDGRKQWQHIAPSDSDYLVAWPLFKKRVPNIPNCKFSEDGKPLGKARVSKKTDLVIFDHVNLQGGGYLLGVRAKNVNDCYESGGYASDFWVARLLDGKTFLLEGFDTSGWPYGLNLVDIGDFAGDGKDEAVFFFSGYNEDGYVLYSNNYRKNVKFTWGYH